jgi:hypothetical protein
MADTIITNTPDRVATDDGAGWIVGIILIIAIIFGGAMLYRSGTFRAAAPANNAADINVTIPNPTANPTTNNGGNTGANGATDAQPGQY